MRAENKPIQGSNDMKKIPLFLSVVAVLGFSMSAQSTTITMSDFSDTSDFSLNGTAQVINSDFLRLGTAGTAFTNNTVSLQNDSSFSAKFTFNFNGQVNGGGDGMTFILHADNSSVGSSGGGMGFGGLNNSFGIEFDTWDNYENNEVSASHIGVNVNGSLSSLAVLDLTNSFGDLDSPSTFWTAWVEYDGVNNDLSVFFNNADVKPGAAILNYNVDLASVIGTSDVYVGFGAASGFAASNHDVHSFAFADDFTDSDAIEPTDVPEPAVASLLGLGALFMFMRRKKAVK